MISAQTRCVCREGKPPNTFPDHALDPRKDLDPPAPAIGRIRNACPGILARECLPKNTCPKILAGVSRRPRGHGCFRGRFSLRERPKGSTAPAIAAMHGRVVPMTAPSGSLRGTLNPCPCHNLYLPSPFAGQLSVAVRETTCAGTDRSDRRHPLSNKRHSLTALRRTFGFAHGPRNPRLQR
jgi:hypothetical protein